MVTHYKCPNCGADMAFDTESGKLKCGSCGRKNTIEEMAGNKHHPKKVKVSYNMDDDDKKAQKASFENDYDRSYMMTP